MVARECHGAVLLGQRFPPMVLVFSLISVRSRPGGFLAPRGRLQSLEFLAESLPGLLRIYRVVGPTTGY